MQTRSTIHDFRHSVYRYGYQGSEKDDEVKGSGNSYTTHFRQLDPRIGRWFTIDPKSSSMPWQSPYISMDGNPVLLNDPYGDKVKFGKFKDQTGDSKFNSRKEFNQAKRELSKDIRNLKQESSTFKKIYKDLDDADDEFILFSTTAKGGGVTSVNGEKTLISIGMGDFPLTEGYLNNGTFDRESSIMSTVAHEFGHAWRNFKGYDRASSINLEYYKPIYPVSGVINLVRDNKINQEKAAVHIENMVKAELINGGRKMNLTDQYFGVFPKAQKALNGKYQAIFSSDILYNLVDEGSRTRYLNGDFNLDGIVK